MGGFPTTMGLDPLPFLWYSTTLIQRRSSQPQIQRPVPSIDGRPELTYRRHPRMVLSEVQNRISGEQVQPNTLTRGRRRLARSGHPLILVDLGDRLRSSVQRR